MRNSLIKKLKQGAVALAAAFLIVPVTTGVVELSTNQVQVVKAAKGDRGTDQSDYQSWNGAPGYGDETFMINQIGGYYNGYFKVHNSYGAKTQTAMANGVHAHTYIYAQFSGRAQADAMLNYYLPKVQTPKGSIVALDVESGNPDTDSVMYALKRVQDAGYTAVLYGYKNFLVNHLNLQYISNYYPLWLAEYPDYSVRRYPNYVFFPSFNNVAIFQFTSTYKPGGLDGDVDLTGITDNGYTKNTNPKVTKPADKPVVNNKVQPNSYTVKAGDSWWSIATAHGLTMYQLAAMNNATINTVIHPGQVLTLKQATAQATKPQVITKGSTWTDSLGDTWHSESGTFTSNTWLHLRWGATPSSSVIAYLGPGATIKYDAWSRHDGFVYLRQPRGNGHYGYIACRDAYTGEAYGTFK